MEFLETVVKHKPGDEEVAVHLVTIEDEFKGEQQIQNLENIKESCLSVGVNFTWEFDRTGTIHCVCQSVTAIQTLQGIRSNVCKEYPGPPTDQRSKS